MNHALISDQSVEHSNRHSETSTTDTNDVTQERPQCGVFASVDDYIMNPSRAAYVVSNIFDNYVPTKCILSKISTRENLDDIRDILCVYKFIMGHCAGIKNYFAGQRMNSIKYYVVQKLIDEFCLIGAVFDLLDGKFVSCTYVHSEQGSLYTKAQKHIIQSLDLTGDVNVDYYKEDRCWFTREDTNKTIDNKTVRVLLKRLAISTDCFRLDWFGPECVEIAKKFDVKDSVIDRIKRNK